MMFDDRTIERGVDYYYDGRVTETKREGFRVAAMVAGTRVTPYTVVMDLHRLDRSVCTCPVGHACKHLVAVVLAVWHDPQVTPDLRGRVAEIARDSGLLAELDEARLEAADGNAQRNLQKASGPYVDTPDLASWRMALLVDAGYGRRLQLSLVRQYRRQDGTWGRLEAYQGSSPVFVPDAASRKLVERLRVFGAAVPLVAFAKELTGTGLPIFAGRGSVLSGVQESPVRVVRPTRFEVEVIPVPLSCFGFGSHRSPSGTDVEIGLAVGMSVAAGRSCHRVPPGSWGLFEEGLGYTIASFTRDAALVLIAADTSPLSELGPWFVRGAPASAASLAGLLELADRHPSTVSIAYPQRVRISEYVPEPVFSLVPMQKELLVRLDLEWEERVDGYEGDEYVINVVRAAPPEDVIDAASTLIGSRPDSPDLWGPVDSQEISGPWFWDRAVEHGTTDPFSIARGLVDLGYTVYVEDRGRRRKVRRAQRMSVRVRSGVDWFAPVVAEGDSPPLSAQELTALAANGRLDDGEHYVLFSPEEMERIRQLLDLTEGVAESHIPMSDIGSFAELQQLADEVPPDLEPIRELAKELVSGERPRAPRTPPGLSATLRPYQRAGFAWLASLARHGLSGCLADDMGLGKTIQALALMLHLRDADGKTSPEGSADAEPCTNHGVDDLPSGGFLVIAPVSTLGNWAREAGRFASSLSTVVHHGSARTASTADLLEAHLVVTSYATAVRDCELLVGIHWKLVVLDEAQAIKNPHARTTKRMKQLPARHRLCLTGTPVENVSTDLWSIMDFLVPGLLGSLVTFNHRFPRRNINGTEQSASRLARLRRTVSPFLLRRTKEAVAPELPTKIETVVTCEMGSKQAAFYERLRAHHQARVREAIDSRDIRKIGAAIFTGLLRLRQAAIRPPDADRSGATVPSAKEQKLIAGIDEVVQERYKALVFSQFVTALSAFHDRVAERGITILYLDGSTRDRETLIRRFQDADGPCVFFISLRAGGTGINLTAADYVFICDPWWNPQVERQAVDRAHRIGRDRPVIVNRLVTAGTIEQKVLELQEQKRALVTDIIEENGDGIDLHSGEELLSLFEAVG